MSVQRSLRFGRGIFLPGSFHLFRLFRSYFFSFTSALNLFLCAYRITMIFFLSLFCHSFYLYLFVSSVYHLLLLFLQSLIDSFRAMWSVCNKSFTFAFGNRFDFIVCENLSTHTQTQIHGTR